MRLHVYVFMHSAGYLSSTNTERSLEMQVLFVHTPLDDRTSIVVRSSKIDDCNLTDFEFLGEGRQSSAW